MREPTERSNLRRRAQAAYQEYRTLMILAGWLTAEDRRRIDRSLYAIVKLPRSRLRAELDRIAKSLNELRDLLEARAKPRTTKSSWPVPRTGLEPCSLSPSGSSSKYSSLTMKRPSRSSLDSRPTRELALMEVAFSNPPNLGSRGASWRRCCSRTSLCCGIPRLTRTHSIVNNPLRRLTNGARHCFGLRRGQRRPRCRRGAPGRRSGRRRPGAWRRRDRTRAW
jgi:hypothetical protein